MAQTMIAMLGAGKTVTDNQHRKLIKEMKKKLKKKKRKERKKENHTADDETLLILPFFYFSSFFLGAPWPPSNVGEGLTGKRLHASTPAMCIYSLWILDHLGIKDHIWHMESFYMGCQMRD